MRYLTLSEVLDLYRFSLIKNHPFVDGNKRLGHAAMETFLVLNGYELDAAIPEQEWAVLGVASGEWERSEFTDGLHDHIVAKNG